ncbi:MAG TPA: hypothetical protein VLT87_28945, partial [Thermoanaerobaculia bacterium]|nr:hypothetical protein [Thermoanaerobaculia bacterium]
PFPFLLTLDSEQLVRQVERRQDRDPRRVGRVHVLGHLSHLAVYEIGQALEVPIVVASTDVVRPAENFNRCVG